MYIVYTLLSVLSRALKTLKIKGFYPRYTVVYLIYYFLFYSLKHPKRTVVYFRFLKITKFTMVNFGIMLVFSPLCHCKAGESASPPWQSRPLATNHN
jgi:hypothetical protein